MVYLIQHLGNTESGDSMAPNRQSLYKAKLNQSKPIRIYTQGALGDLIDMEVNLLYLYNVWIYVYIYITVVYWLGINSLYITNIKRLWDWNKPAFINITVTNALLCLGVSINFAG